MQQATPLKECVLKPGDYFANRIAEAQAEMATWSEERLAGVQLQGPSIPPDREPTCRHCGCWFPCPC